MRKIGNIYVSIIVTLLAIWLLPRLYYIITAESYSTPFTLYSCIAHDFVSLEDHSGKDYIFQDTEGRMYGDSVLPFFYYRVLSSRNKTPEYINGHEITGEEIERNNIIFSSSPKDVNSTTANVYMLLESCPPRLELEDAEYAFVTRKNGFKIVRISENKSDKKLEAAFNASLDSAGFHHPAALVCGNPSTRKAYDEGYLLTDASGNLFHIKLMEGKPYVEQIPVNGLSIKNIFITENENRTTLAYLVDLENRFYILDSHRHIIRTDVVADVTKQSVLLVGDVLNYTFKVSDSDGEDFWALDSETFRTVKTLRRDYPEPDSFDLPKYVLPTRLALSSPLDTDIKPRFKDFSWLGLGVDLILIAAVYFLAVRCNRKKQQKL